MLNPRELATVLAALRYWQQQQKECEATIVAAFPQFSEERPLSADEIDQLCERLNRSSESPSVASISMDART